METMTKEQRTEEIMKLLKEYRELSGEPIDLDRLAVQLASVIDSKFES